SGFIAKHDHPTLLHIVQIVEPAAVGNWHVADHIEIRQNSKDLATALIEIADRANVATLDHGNSQTHIRALDGNVDRVFVRQVILPHAGKAAVDGGSAAAPNEHDVFAEFIEFLALPGAETFAQSDQ